MRQIGTGLFMWLPTEMRISDLELDGASCELTLRLDQTGQGVRPVAVNVRSVDGAPITSTTLRAVRLWEAARLGIAEAVFEGQTTEQDDGGVIFSGRARHMTDEAAAQIRQGGPTDEALGWVATVYNLAEVLGLPPARQVEIDLGLPRTTASKWIRRAREKGLIGGIDQQA